MSDAKHITIVGGGLAGLTLGIGLRRERVPVTIQEAGHYPRHRVCGEFISGRGQKTLTRLGLRELIEGAGAIQATSAVFFKNARTVGPRPLPANAISLSRYKMDRTLADEFQRLGGELRCGQRWRDGDYREGLVRATGRRPHPEENGVRFFGIKIHARKVSLAADLEMHVLPRAYVGICRLPDGEVNVCGLFWRLPGEDAGGSAAREWLRGPPDSLLRERLNGAEMDEASFCAVAGLSLRPEMAAHHTEISIGDAITMIPPVTGNGMSMAFESAELAIAPLTAWSRGEIPWVEARRQVADRCDAAFARRLMWAKWLQRFLVRPALQNPLFALASRGQWLWNLAFERTR